MKTTCDEKEKEAIVWKVALMWPNDGTRKKAGIKREKAGDVRRERNVRRRKETNLVRNMRGISVCLFPSAN